MTFSDETDDRDIDGYFLKLSPDCELLWSTYFFTRNSISDDKVLSIASDGGNRLYFTGWVEPKEFQTVENIIPLQDYSISSSYDYYQSIISNQSPGDPFNIPAFDGIWGCFDSLKLENTAGFKLNEAKSDIFSIYPNPTNNSLFIAITKGLLEDFILSISDISGKEIPFSLISKEHKIIHVDLSSIPDGFYIVCLFTKYNVYSKKLIVIK